MQRSIYKPVSNLTMKALALLIAGTELCHAAISAENSTGLHPSHAREPMSESTTIALAVTIPLVFFAVIGIVTFLGSKEASHCMHRCC